MTWTQTQLDALEAALALGSRRVKFDDEEVEYRSLNEMRQLRDLMRRELGQVPKQRTFQRSSGGKGIRP